jgi:hypothetical protein
VNDILGDDAAMESLLRDIFDTWLTGRPDVPRIGLVRHTGRVELHALPFFGPDASRSRIDQGLRHAAKQPQRLVHSGGLDDTFIGLSLLGLADLGDGQHRMEVLLVGRNKKIYDITFEVPSSTATALPPTIANTNALVHGLVPAAVKLVRALHRELAARR